MDRTPPVSWIRLGLVAGTRFIQSKARKGKINISSDDLEQALALTKESTTSDEDHKILEGIIKFGNTKVRQIMKPRMDVHAIEINATFDEVMEIILEMGEQLNIGDKASTSMKLLVQDGIPIPDQLTQLQRQK